MLHSASPYHSRGKTLTSPTVFIVDDDLGIRHSIAVLLGTAGLKVECFPSAKDFLDAFGPDRRGCLLLDVRMPGMSGPELQRELVRRGLRLPIIFLSAYGDLETGVDAIKQGAVEFLTKPVNGALLLKCVVSGLELDRQQRQADEARRLFEERLHKLTGREREVLALAITGMSNKAISAQLRISLRTIEGHRSRIYLKTGNSSLIELAHQAASNGVALADIAGRPMSRPVVEPPSAQPA